MSDGLRASDTEPAASAPAAFSATHRRPIAADRLRRHAGMALYYLVLVLAAAAFLIPVVWLVLGSFKLNAEFRAYPIVILPRTPIWDNYYDALTLVPFSSMPGARWGWPACIHCWW